MNILIAGIISVIMLLVGGKFYNDYRNGPAATLDVWRQNRDVALKGFNLLPKVETNGKILTIIANETMLIEVIQYLPSCVRSCAIVTSPTFTQERALEILQPYAYSVRRTCPNFLSEIQNQFFINIED